MSEGSGVAKAREQSTRTFFDRFAGRCAEFLSRAPFFTFSVLWRERGQHLNHRGR